MKAIRILKIIILFGVICACAVPCNHKKPEPKSLIYTAIWSELVEGEWITYEGPNADL